jgi:hypothetical protein
MADNAWKWVLGCGAGCAVAAIIVAIALGFGAYFVKGVVEDVVGEVERSERAESALVEKYGRFRDFTPPAGGAIPPERVETFLAAREIMAPDREELESALALLSSTDDDAAERRGGAIDKMRAGMGLVPKLIGYYSARNGALLEAGMGNGEYAYLYTLAYYSWLGKSPADGPPFTLVGDSDRDGTRFHSDFGAEDESDVRERRLERALPSLNRRLLPILINQRAALDDLETGDEPAGWRLALADEITAMETDPDRIPWQDGLPEVIAESLEPFRERLDAAYSPLCNTLELEGGGH